MMDRLYVTDTKDRQVHFNKGCNSLLGGGGMTDSSKLNE